MTKSKRCQECGLPIRTHGHEHKPNQWRQKAFSNINKIASIVRKGKKKPEDK